MTEYRSTHPSDHRLKLDGKGRISVHAFHAFKELPYFVQLSDADRVELAFELLEKDYHVQPHVSDGGYTMIPRPRRAKVGEYYRVKSTPRMSDRFQNEPIVKVVEIDIDRSENILLQFPDGSATVWGRNLKNLEGPIKVEEKVVFQEVKD